MKLVIDEPGSARSRALWYEADACLSSVALYAEARAAIAAARRAGRLDDVMHRAGVRVLHDVWARIQSIELTEPLALRAGELAEAYSLRGYDAVHLASVEAIADPGTVLITADHALASAAASLGLVAVVPAA